jgi:hypothetical protein
MKRYVRRSRVDLQLGQFLQIGQQWRLRETGSIWRVRQIHRQDCVVELEHGPVRWRGTFERLRQDFKWIAAEPILPVDANGHRSGERLW